ncbi:MAG TPA: cysteine desulfurase [Alphaproteobacteria bacterium]|nr:cysteine desulfurase [Alphaproteobacteria bacterium]
MTMSTGAAASAQTRVNTPAYDVARVRRDFPILTRTVHGRPLVYLDNGASAQKPLRVIETMRQVMEEDYANVHRGVHFLSQRATERYEAARETVARFLNAAPREIVFTRNFTESINLVAATYGRRFLEKGDEVVVSAMEHHANIVPWQMLENERGIRIRVVPVDDAGDLRMDVYESLLSPKTRLVAMTHCSNVLGTVTPAAEIVRLAHGRGIPVLLDGAQAVVHRAVDVKALDVDFYGFTGHKLYGPTGIGVLYGKYELLAKMPPYQGGGDMIRSVSFSGTTFKDPPERFEAGTPAIVEAIGLAAAIDYVTELGQDAIATHEQQLLDYATRLLSAIPGLRIYGAAAEKAAILSFTLETAHAHDIGTIVDRAGVALRTGHHCAQPLMERLGVAGTARASFGLYNTHEEVDRLAEAIRSVEEIFGR